VFDKFWILLLGSPVPQVSVSCLLHMILFSLQNHGEEISLRLRTDDLEGFRKYESIKKTLLHELVSVSFS